MLIAGSLRSIYGERDVLRTTSLYKGLHIHESPFYKHVSTELRIKIMTSLHRIFFLSFIFGKDE